MQAVEQHPYVEPVLSPLAGESPQGQLLEEDPTLEFLDGEIMKMGSLSHGEIEWDKVEQEALRLLSDISKDLKVLGFLLLALQRGGSGERFALSIHLLCEVMQGWWTDAWPYPGAKGARPRKMMFAQMMQRAGAEVGRLSFDSAVGDGRQYCLDRLDRLKALAEAESLATDGIDDLRHAITNLPEVGQVAEAPAAPASTQETPARRGGAATTSSGASGSLGSVTLDPKDERATRQSLLRVADLLTDLEPGSPLGYQMRRFAIWYNITATPPARKGGRSDLAAVSSDRVSEYRESLGRGVDMNLWGRIEQSLSVSPFWLEGHYLSAQAAEQTGHPKCAEAIRNALKGFIDRLPALADMTFSDGSPFLPKPVREWLLTSSPGGAGKQGRGADWHKAYEKAQDVLKQDGLAPAMKLLEDGLSKAKEPRAQFYWRLMSAELLRDSGMKALAKQQFGDLKQQASGRTLEDWEPSLVAHLERLT
ncbi:type VI secretion system protein TssA [Marinobacter sp. JSM 1782161]|uniref:type VI secretion system protein TssA n=1 Tax=Marinobacter sp. JSM 1782161 TaxID=2685906 RepID=UPI0014025A07|nr:type VI secretion system protein TssA [Marinobacter sp. JSM 1782161]